MIYGYIRVSSKEQNVDRQLDAFTELGIEAKNIFTDKQSAMILNVRHTNG